MLWYNRSMDDTQEVATLFKALGDPTRLRIFDFLRSKCCAVALEASGDVRPVAGPSVGEVCCHVTGLDKINSTISHHLKELRRLDPLRLLLDNGCALTLSAGCSRNLGAALM